MRWRRNCGRAGQPVSHATYWKSCADYRRCVGHRTRDGTLVCARRSGGGVGRVGMGGGGGRLGRGAGKLGGGLFSAPWWGRGGRGARGGVWGGSASAGDAALR